MSRFLIAASCICLVTTTAQGANWLPSSPLVQIGDDLDLFFDSAVAFEITDNLFTGSIKKSASNWSLTPGFALEYGKDSAFSLNLTAKRSYVYYNAADLRGLNDSRDALTAAIRFADGGPLSVNLDSSYRVTARNDDLVQQGVSNVLLGPTLVRQANYSNIIKFNYRLTEKFKVSIGFGDTFNHYINPVKVETASGSGNFDYNTNTLSELNTKSIPLNIDYQAFEKLSFGLALQHDVTDYSHAPFFSSYSAQVALPHRQLTKDFAGLTANGQLTESGKLNGIIKVGCSQFAYDAGTKNSDLSYSISLNHALTERIGHSLSLARDVSANSTNNRMKTQNYTYGMNFTAAEDLTFNLSVTKSDSLSNNNLSDTLVNTITYSLGADYKYNAHLSFQAGYNFSDSKTPSTPASNYNSSTFTLSAAFRY